MKLTFLGSGSFFAGNGNYHSNLLLETDSGANLLIDCGSDIKHSLIARGKKPQDIHGIYVSHPHDDHAGGLEFMGFVSYFTPGMEKPHLFCHESMLDQLWYGRLALAMTTMPEKDMKFSDYFRLNRIKHHFEFGNVRFRLVPGIHIVNHKSGHMYSYGLFMKLNTVKVYFTSDIAYPDMKFESSHWDMESHWRNFVEADVIFHDCETINASKVHAHYNFLDTLPPSIKSKMWLYHTQSSAQPDAKADGFMGIVQGGQEFKF